jgi:hypothetical protein
MIDSNSIYNKLTKPIRDSKINKILSNISLDRTFPADVEFNFRERLIVKHQLIETFIPWVNQYLDGLHGFNFKYIANGNSDAVNMVFMNRDFKRVYFLKNEYSYYAHICSQLNIDHLAIDESDIDIVTKDDLFLISIPSSYNGSSDDRIRLVSKLQEKEVKLFIDVAYCGLTTPFYLKLVSTKNTYLAFTFSKSSSLSFNRIAILFSDFNVPGLEIMNKLGYVNLSGAHAAIAIMKNMPVDYFYNTYKDQYNQICQTQNLIPTNCILFGHDQQGGKTCTTPYYTLY